MICITIPRTSNLALEEQHMMLRKKYVTKKLHEKKVYPWLKNMMGNSHLALLMNYFVICLFQKRNIPTPIKNLRSLLCQRNISMSLKTNFVHRICGNKIQTELGNYVIRFTVVPAKSLDKQIGRASCRERV